MKTNYIEKLPEIINGIENCAIESADLESLMSKARECLLSSLSLRAAWSAIYDDSKNIDCRIDHSNAEPKTDVSISKEKISLPKCASYLLSRTSQVVFSSPSSMCAECCLMSECVQSDTQCAPLLFGDDYYGVLGIIGVDESFTSISGQSFLKIISGYCSFAIRLKKLEDDRQKNGLILMKASKKQEKLAEELRQIQKIESIGRLAGGIAHDLNNLLSPVIGYSEMALFDMHPEDTLYDDLTQILSAAQRAKDLTQQLLAFSRKQVLKMSTLKLSDVVFQSEKMLRRLIREDIEISYKCDHLESTVRGDASQIQQILINLALNAADSMPGGGKMIVETHNVIFDDAYVALHPVAKKGRYVILSVSDTGQGMSKEILECIFDPFFTTKKKGKGSGLGLSTAYGIVKQHGGYIWAYSELGMGTVLKLYFPATSDIAEVVRNSSYHPKSVSGSETILVVEDEETVRRLICKILLRQGYAIVEATSVENAINIAKSNESEIDLLLTDVVMPVMNGKQLHSEILKYRPRIKVLYVSGYTDDVIVHHGVLEEGVMFVQKPFSMESLTKLVRKALDD